jgi:alkaline phosphatase
MKHLEGYFRFVEIILVPKFAYGAEAHQFSGIYENTEIFKKILGLIKKY